MILSRFNWIAIFLLQFTLHTVIAQESIDDQFLSYEDFVEPGENWKRMEDVWWSMDSQPMRENFVKGDGILVNVPTKKHRDHLLTRDSYGDVELELDFMMAPESNSGIYLMGRYEVQLLDSWKKEFPAHFDCGGIYQRWDEKREGPKGFEGIPPLVNACRAPGLWQNLRILFRAPQFDGNGKKIKNARFEKVYLNGVLVQSQVEVRGPTRSSLYSDEQEKGPLMVQGDHGKVALKNIKIRNLGEMENTENGSVEDPIYVQPHDSPYVLRSFLEFNGEKLPYAVSVGHPEGINYSYDTQQGALLQVWRGDFVETTGMWHRRGNSQLAVPVGSVVLLSDSPTIGDKNLVGEDWIKRYGPEDLKIEGYVLDEKRNPTFKYSVEGSSVEDQIIPLDDRSGLLRRIKASSGGGDWVLRLAAGSEIRKVATNLYRIGGTYYVNVDEKFMPVINSTGNEQELKVPLSSQFESLEYKIIW